MIAFLLKCDIAAHIFIYSKYFTSKTQILPQFIVNKLMNWENYWVFHVRYLEYMKMWATVLRLKTKLWQYIMNCFQHYFCLNGCLSRSVVCTVNTLVAVMHCTRKNLTTCSKSANKPLTSCVRTTCYKLSTSLEQAVNNL